MFSGATAFSTTNYDLLLVALNNNAGSLQKSVQLDVDSYYGPTAAMARANLSSTDSWVISDAGLIGSAPTAITHNTIAGVTAPVRGATPVSVTTADAQFTGTVTWSPSDGTFGASTSYTATITLTPTTGYTLTGVGANSFSVAGATSVTNSADSGVITATFPATAAAAPTTITQHTIAGVTAPVRGATPVSVTTADAQFTGTVTWSPSDGTFGASTSYTATITLTPTTGYTLTGVGANSFSVAGATSVTNSADSGVITATFPATAAAQVIIINNPSTSSLIPITVSATHPTATVHVADSYSVTASSNDSSATYSFTVTSGTNCSVVAGTGVMTFNAAGTCTVTISATAGGANYTGSASATEVFTVSAIPAPVITVSSPRSGTLVVRILKASAGSTGYQYSLNGGVWKRALLNSRHQLILSHLVTGHTYKIRLRGVNTTVRGPSSKTYVIRAK